MGARTALSLLLALSLACPPATAVARDGPQIGREAVPIPAARPANATFDAAGLCLLIADAAEDHRLPPEFFARLIWKESRFDVRALSPVGAQGVAQFMPGTAELRGLKDPWDPRQAIPASASFLADLRAQFGNLGLAAAAYNGGPGRVERWLASGGGLPSETTDYVVSITHRPVDWFRKAGREVEARPLEKGLPFQKACAKLPVIATRAMGVAAGRKPWGVQIAAGITHSAAMRAFDRARAQLSSVVGGKGAIIVRSRKVGGRAAYSARVGADSQGEAVRLCQRIRRAGTPCVVRRN